MEIDGWDFASVGAKAIAYAATLGCAGAIFFLSYGGELLHEPQRARIRHLIGVLLILSAAASGMRVAIASASMGGGLAGVFDRSFAVMFLNAGEGRALAARCLGLGLAAGAFLENQRYLPAALAGAVIAAVSFSFVGHVHALHSVVLTILLCAHLLCAAYWLGALIPFLITAQAGSDLRLALLAARFGKIALVLVALLLISGAILLWNLMENPAQMLSSDFGRLFLLKLLLVALLLAFAGVNRLYLTPRLLASQAGALLKFRLSVRIEIVVAALILLVTAAFTTITGPNS